MKEKHLIYRYHGITVVWVDDRVLVDAIDQRKLTEAKIRTDEATCMDEAWFTAVLGRDSRAIDAMVIAEQQRYATIALGLMQVCEDCSVNLILTDFENAHNKWFRAPNAIFLLDIQNLMKPLGRYFQKNGIDDVAWDWNLYGLHCAVAYQMPLSRFRFLTRFRSQIAPHLPPWANSLFPDYTVFEGNAVLLDADIRVVKQRISEFIKDYLIHKDPYVTEMLLWFLGLPLTQNGTDNHNALGDVSVLEQMNRKFKVTETQADSAKAVALGANNWPICPAAADCYQLQVSVFLGVLNVLALAEVQLEGLRNSDWLRLPCCPGMPMFLSLKALIDEMNRCPTYLGPTAITIGAIHKSATLREYRLKLLLEDTARDGAPVNMTAFKRSFDEWDVAGREPSEKHQTRQRIGDLLRCKLTVRDGYTPPNKASFLSGADVDVMRVEFNETPSRIEFIWEAQS